MMRFGGVGVVVVGGGFGGCRCARRTLSLMHEASLATKTRPLTKKTRTDAIARTWTMLLSQSRPLPTLTLTRPQSLLSPRLYSGTSFVSSSNPSTATVASGDDHPSSSTITTDAKAIARRYNVNRAQYKRQVTLLRKQYAAEYAAVKAVEKAARAMEQERVARLKHERQRAKNERSALRAKQEERKRRKRLEEKERRRMEARLGVEAQQRRMKKARELALKELEEEAPFWLTSSREVALAFGTFHAGGGDGKAAAAAGEDAIAHARSQSLWSRPGGYVGSAHPGTDDAPFWKYECHHWDMSRTYQTPRDLLLEYMEERAYIESNVDVTSYWTRDRILAAERREYRAKLRARVREEGRHWLLERQRVMMKDAFAQEEARAEREDGASLSKVMPPPDLRVLADWDAHEREGVRILLEEDPGRFFRFELDDDDHRDHDDNDNDYNDDDDDDNNNVVHSEMRADGTRGKGGGGAHRGRPIDLRDPIRDPHNGAPYPLVLGRLPKPDERTDAQRRRDERERRMWEAARKAEEEAKMAALSGATTSGDGAGAGAVMSVSKNIEAAAEMSLDDGTPPIVYDDFGNAKSEFDAEWEEGLDPNDPADAYLLNNTSSEWRYDNEDIDWVVSKLKEKVDLLQELEEMERRAAISAGGGGGSGDNANADTGEWTLTDEEFAAAVADAQAEPDSDWKKGAIKTQGIDDKSARFVQYDLPPYDLPGKQMTLARAPSSNNSVHELLRRIEEAERQALVDGDGDYRAKGEENNNERDDDDDDDDEEEEIAKQMRNLAKQFNLEELLDYNNDDIHDVIGHYPSTKKKDTQKEIDALVQANMGDQFRRALSGLTKEEVSALLSTDVMSDLDDEMKHWDANADNVLDADVVASALRRALPNVDEKKLRELVDLELALEKDGNVRKAVLGEGGGGRKEKDMSMSEKKEEMIRAKEETGVEEKDEVEEEEEDAEESEHKGDDAGTINGASNHDDKDKDKDK